MTENNFKTDSEKILNDAVDMKEHLAALSLVDPKLAQQIDATWRSTATIMQRLFNRSLAARLILGGAKDDVAVRIVTEEGTKAALSMLTGGREMPDSVRRALGKFSPGL